MAFKEQLIEDINKIFCTNWKERGGTVVPTDTSVTLGNDAVKIEGTILYADLADSTLMVNSKTPTFSAEVYKAFLHSAAKIIGEEGGAIVSYDGDRVMAVFIGNNKNTAAVKAALKINWATANIVQPSMKAIYTNTTFTINHVVGIDTCELFVAKTGVRGANDLVWVGRAANWAAKMASIKGYPTWITQAVYEKLHASAKLGADGIDMWVQCTWNTMGNAIIYRSTYWWPL